MKKLISVSLALALLCCVSCGDNQESSTEPSGSVSEVTTEEATEPETIPESTTEVPTEPLTEESMQNEKTINAVDIMQYFIDNNAPNLGEYIERTESDDNLLGRPNQYTSKVSFKITTVEPNEEDPYDASIEVFDNKEDALKRYEELKVVIEKLPFFNEYFCLKDNVLFRMKFDVLPSDEKIYEQLLNEYIESSISESATEPPTENQAIDVYINAEPIVLDNGKVKFKVETNLPDETKLTLYLCKDDIVVSNDAKVTVKNGIGESSELFKFPSNDNDSLVSGDYELITSMYPSRQSDNVKKAIGENGEYLKGNIVEKAEYGDEYNVYKTEQITLTFAGTEETAEYINGNLLEDMFAQVEHRINYIEISNTYYIQIWYAGLGDKLDAGISKSSDLSDDVTSLCKSALELCRTNDTECNVLLEVIDDRDVDSASDTLIIYSTNGVPAIAVY